MLFVETPTNPILTLTDLGAAAGLAHRHGLRLVVDNTFASPYVQRPIEFGADIVVHSTTKYLNGHSDSVGGVVIATRDDDIEWLQFVQNAEGAILGPFDSWLVLRGTKTLPLRMVQHNANGLALAQFLAAHPKVRRVYYPGLPSHPQHELAKRQMRGFGGMLSFDLGSLEAARRVLNGVRLHALAESLGGVETLISHPATMTHASVPAERRAALGITDGLVRISAGIEDIDDLKEDLAQALDRLMLVIDFLLHSDRKLLELVATYGSWVYGDAVRDRVRGNRLRGHAVSAGRLPALRHGGALRDGRAQDAGGARAPRPRRVHRQRRQLRGRARHRPARVQRDGSIRALASPPQSGASSAGARLLRAIRRQGGHPRPLRAHRAHLRAVRRGGGADDVRRRSCSTTSSARRRGCACVSARDCCSATCRS